MKDFSRNSEYLRFYEGDSNRENVMAATSEGQVPLTANRFSAISKVPKVTFKLLFEVFEVVVI